MSNEGGPWEADKLKHIPGQEGSVDKPLTQIPENASHAEREQFLEKAQKMASTEDYFRSFATLYEKYQADPDPNKSNDNEKFSRAHREELLRYNNPYAYGGKTHGGGLEAMRTLSENNVSPEYVKKMGEVQAEIAGKVFDYRKSVTAMSPQDLAKEYQSVKEAWQNIPKGLEWQNFKQEVTSTPGELEHRTQERDLIIAKLNALESEIKAREQIRQGLFASLTDRISNFVRRSS